MLGIVASFRIIGLPFNVLGILQKNLRRKAIDEFMGFNFDSFSRENKKFYYQQLDEKRYSVSKRIHHWSHIPFQSKKKKVGSEYHYIQIRETGSIAYVVERKIEEEQGREELARDVEQILKKQNGFLSSLGGAKLAKEAKQRLKIESSRKNPEKHQNWWSVSQPVSIAIVEAKTRGNSDLAKQAEGLGKLLRIQNPLLKTEFGEYRLHSKRFHLLLTDAFPRTKRGKGLFRSRILSSTTLAYGIQQSLMSSNAVILDKNLHAEPIEWDALIHFMNPLVLEGKLGFSAMLGSSLSRSWFIQTERAIRLRETYQSVMQSLPLLSDSAIAHFPAILLSLLKLTGRENTSSAWLDPPSLPEATIVLGKLEKRIIEELRKHEEIIQNKIKALDHGIDLKFQRGLTKSKIVEKIGASSGKFTLKVTTSLKKLERAGLVSKAPYLGPGRRKESSWMYFLSDDLTKYRKVLHALIQDRVVNAIQRIETMTKA